YGLRIDLLRVRLMAVSVLGLVLVAPAGSAAAAGPSVSPANGARITSDTVTVTTRSSLLGGSLTVDGVRRDSGIGTLRYTIDGHQVANGSHSVVARTGLLAKSRTESTFQMAVPAYAPSGVSVSVSGSTVSVGWNRGGEPDLTGYTVSSRYGSGSTSANCANGRCALSFQVPATAGGDLPVSVVAHRTGSGPSGPSGGTAKLVATARPGSGPAPSSSAATTPAPSAGAKNKDKSLVRAADKLTSPQPTEGGAPLPSLAPQSETTPVSSIQNEADPASDGILKAGIFAVFLVVVLVCAHFGTWGYRQRRRAALVLSGRKARHGRKRRGRRPAQAAPGLDRDEAGRLTPPNERAHEVLASLGYSPDAEAEPDFRPPWT
ncbi:MAG: hypothetical protein ABIQ26_01275, partial [Streptosporangiaceae bacterium]